MRISVIVTCKGRLRFLKQTAPRLIGQPDLEYVLVDWDCPEGAGDWIESAHPDAKIVRVKDQPVFDVSAARNAGALAASGELLVFTDVDMLYEQGFADAIRAEWEPGMMLLFGDREGDCGFIVMTRENFFRSGGYDERYTSYGYEDHEMRKSLEVLGLTPKLLTRFKRYHIHHSNEERTRYYVEKDKRVSQRINERRLAEEPLRLFHGYILDGAARARGGPAVDLLSSLDVAPSIATVMKIVAWKKPRRVLDLYASRHHAQCVARIMSGCHVHAYTDRNAPREVTQREEQVTEPRRNGKTGTMDYQVLDAKEIFETIRRQALHRGPYDLACIHCYNSPQHVAVDTDIALSHVNDDGTVVWLGYGRRRPEVRTFIDAISEGAIARVEETDVAFTQLRAELRQRLVCSVRAQLQQWRETERLMGTIEYHPSDTECVQLVDDRPQVSAIISLYRSEPFIDDFLHRLLKQTILHRVELIFVLNIDNTSPGDRVLQRLEQLPAPHKKIVEVPREGLYTSWNRALRMSTASYVCNLNHDDYHFYNALELMKMALDQFQEADLCYGLTTSYAARISREDFDKANNRRRTKISVHPVASRKRAECCPMWRKAVHDQLGMFDESYVAAGDHEMWVRMLEAGKRIIEIGEVTAVYYRHKDSLSARLNPGYREVRRIIERYGERHR